MLHRPRLLPPLLCAVLGAGLVAPGEARAGNAGRRVTPIVEVVQEVGPAVVNIASSREVEIRDPFYRFLHGPTQTSQSLGSGVVFDADGYVVTNAHVVPDPKADIVVKLGQGEPLRADVIWIDQGNDLALLRIRGEGPFPSARLGGSGDLMIGETVVALGNPFGFDNTVSAGILSATNRSLRTPAGTAFVDFLQTDAALHPGNSGGPLVNLNGEVIGINTMVQRGTEAIGFAIPIDRVREVLLERLTNFTQIRGIYLGARLAEAADGAPRVRFVEPASPAAEVGLAPGDVIRAVDGAPVASRLDFNKQMLERTPGETVRLEVERADRRRAVDLTLAPYSRNPMEILWRHLGVQVADRDSYGRRFQGVVVTQVADDGPGAELGLQRGDLIQQVEGQTIESIEAFYWAVTESTANELALSLVRGGTRYEGEIRRRPLGIGR